jgi:uncharacterized protein
MNIHEKINYVEFPTKDIEATKKFFTSVFGWTFIDYGPDYIYFANEGINGGFYKSELNFSTEKGTPLIIFYSDNLENTRTKIIKNGGTISKEIFEFPGGRRFHFYDKTRNEYSVWSDKN